jgi:excisionase family DNA binding protein
MNVIKSVFCGALDVEKQKDVESECRKVRESDPRHTVELNLSADEYRWLELTSANAGVSIERLMHQILEGVRFDLLDEVEPDVPHIEPFEPEQEYLTTNDIANRLKVTRQSVVNWIKHGKLKATKPAGVKEFRISKDDYLSFLKNGIR